MGTTSEGGDSGHLQRSTDLRGLISDADGNDMTDTCRHDVLGRQTADAATTLGAGVDGAVRLLTTAYGTGGRPSLYTSYADPTATTIVNQVAPIYIHNSLGQLAAEWQSHFGPIQSGKSLEVQYGYSFVASLDGPNHSGRVSLG